MPPLVSLAFTIAKICVYRQILNKNIYALWVLSRLLLPVAFVQI